MAAQKHIPRLKMRKDLSADYARSLLNYDPKTGFLRWKHRKNATAQWNGRYAGKITGIQKDRHGHCRITIDDAHRSAHRIIWLMMTGIWPEHDIDHKNGNRSDNRWKNLRQATRAENLWNMQQKACNKSGFKGVSWSKPGKKWVAQIRGGSKNHYLGLFNTPEEAHAAYQRAATDLHGQFARFS